MRLMGILLSSGVVPHPQILQNFSLSSMHLILVGLFITLSTGFHLKDTCANAFIVGGPPTPMYFPINCFFHSSNQPLPYEQFRILNSILEYFYFLFFFIFASLLAFLFSFYLSKKFKIHWSNLFILYLQRLVFKCPSISQ